MRPDRGARERSCCALERSERLPVQRGASGRESPAGTATGTARRLGSARIGAPTLPVPTEPIAMSQPCVVIAQIDVKDLPRYRPGLRSILVQVSTPVRSAERLAHPERDDKPQRELTRRRSGSRKRCSWWRVASPTARSSNRLVAWIQEMVALRDAGIAA